MGSNPEFTARRIEKIVKHGHKRRGAMTAEYQTWLGMKRRCYDTKSKDFANWGGRGIRVCARWNASFEAFLTDMGPRPDGRYSIDRINNDGHYEPGNCRWATVEQQGENTRLTLKIMHDGVMYSTLAAACRSVGIPITRAHYRLKAGMPMDRVLSRERLSRWS